MKLRQPSRSGRKRGVAVVVVLTLLFLAGSFISNNSSTLRSLEREIQLVEERQLRKYKPAR